MTRVRTLIAIAMTSSAPLAALACGACVEDKVAATYDHAVIQSAMSRHQQVVFVTVDGPTNAGKFVARVKTAASGMRGVEAGTLRTSIAPNAFSFALDAAQEPEAAVAGFRKAVGNASVRLTLVRILRDGALIEPK